MLRPERMSRVSVVGSKRVMDDVVETVHDLRMLHVTEYDGSWDGFDPGDPRSGADEYSDELVTVRALESILDVDGDDAGPVRDVDADAVGEELEEVRQEVNALDDSRDEIRDELRTVEDRLDAIEPFVGLGIDLDLLSGYDELSVRAGRGDPAAVDAALEESSIDEYETFSGGDLVAVVARADEDRLHEVVVGTRFTVVEVPDPDEFQGVEDTDPAAYVDHLEHRRDQLEARLSTVEDELEDVRLDVGGFLLAAEEALSIEVQKQEAPLSFATTENSFVAQGWIPSEEYARFESELEAAVGDHVEVQEVERAAYNADGHPIDHEEVEESSSEDEAAEDGASPDATGSEEGVAADGGEADEVAPDGGVVTTGDDQPPVVMDNPSVADPFELLVETVERPRYGEFDPTVIFLLTFPAFYGFMIGDVAYGILYVAIGFVLWRRFESDALRALGGIAMWAGAFTFLFGIAYGEFLGLHFVGEWYGGPLMKKGIQPNAVNYARAWLVVATIVGLIHMTVGYALGFAKNASHGLANAFYESGSWALLFAGIWIWIFSRHMGSAKPSFLFEVFSGDPFHWGFAGFPPSVGLLGLAVAAVGIVGVAIGEIRHEGVVAGVIIAFLEGGVGAIANVLSYTRLTAVLLAKGAMALVVNLLFFGAYQTGEGEHAVIHFATGHMPHVGEVSHGHEVTEVLFPGLLHGGALSVLLGILVFVIGHLVVLALGVTSAGLQSVRLEYVEFMTKFYEGGGQRYDPFGYVRRYTRGE